MAIPLTQFRAQNQNALVTWVQLDILNPTELVSTNIRRGNLETEETTKK